MELKDLSKPLSIKDIDFRIQNISIKWWAIILAYKDARADMKRLDDVCTPLNWKREHTRDNQNCIVSIYDESKKEWVSKEDTWTESNTEKEKWLASDSFKRACFNWGIGRELYDYPLILIQLNEDEFETFETSFNNKKIKKAKPTYNFKLKNWEWSLNSDDNWKVLWLFAKDQSNKLRFKYWKPKES